MRIRHISVVFSASCLRVSVVQFFRIIRDSNMIPALRPTVLGVFMAAVHCVPCRGNPAAPPRFAEGFERPDPTGRLPLGWTHFSGVRTVELSTERVAVGRYSLKVIDEDPVNAVGLRSPHIAVPPNQTVWVSWQYYGEPGNSQSIYIEFWTADGKRPKPRAKSWFCRGTGSWVKGLGRVRPPPGTASITVHANSFSTNVATGYFDNIEFGVGPRSTYDRSPRPPARVRHPCGLYKPADIARAKRNVTLHPWARNVLDRFRSSSAFWLNCPDEKLAYWIPDLTPFRVVDCPKCGAGWRFAWTNLSYERIRCRKCDFIWPDPAYPEEDVQTFLDPLGKDQSIPYYKGDPSPVYGSAKSSVYRLSGRLRYHRIGRLGSLGSLGKVYALTGEREYAAKVRRVLLRLAEVYPRYLPHDWGRIYDHYGNLQSGKLSGWKLHDASVFIQLALAYDLTSNSDVYSTEDRVRIEEGCFREFLRLMTATSPKGQCINDGPTAMAAGALAGLLLADHRAIAWAIEPPDGFIGFLEKYFLRDGHWYEASPSYESMSLGRLYVTPEALRGYSDPPSYDGADRYDKLDLFTHPLLKKILVAASRVRMPDGHLPATNDSVLGAGYPRSRAEQNNHWYPSEGSLELTAWAFGGKDADSGDEYSLFRRDPDLDLSSIEPAAPSASSLVRPGAGWAILRSGDGRDDAALFLDYGPHGSGHGHPDRLNIIYYDFGRELVTDLGYLGAGHPLHPWIRSTASHNQVIVDGKPQGRKAGELLAFCGRGSVQAAIAAAPAVYPGLVDIYERSLLFVNRGPGRRYVIDRFVVRGGADHQYAFHADCEVFTAPGVTFEKMDKNALGEGSTGYKWLRTAEKANVADTFSCEWGDGSPSGLRTRLTVLGRPGSVLVHARAPGLRNRSDPFGDRDLQRIFVRRPGPENEFVSIIQGYQGRPLVEKASALSVRTDSGRAGGVAVQRASGTDLALFADEAAAGAGVAVAEFPGLEFRGRLGFVGMEAGKVTHLWLLGGSTLIYGDLEIRGAAPVRGKIAAVHPREFSIAVDRAISPGRGWAGTYLTIDGKSDGAYRIDRVTNVKGGARIRLADEPILNIAEGDAFTLFPSISLRRLSEQVWHVTGAEIAVGLPAVSRPEDLGRLYVKRPGGTWEGAGKALAFQAGTVHVSPTLLERGEAWIWTGEEAPATDDRTAPALLELRVDGRGMPILSDVGYLPSLGRIELVFEEPSRILPGGVEAVLRGEAHGLVPLSCKLARRREEEMNDGRQTVVVRPVGGSVPADRFSLSLSVSDSLLNREEYSISLNTIGMVLPFGEMSVVRSNGRASKFMSGLSTMFYRSETPGDVVEYEFSVPEGGRYSLLLRHTKYDKYGIFQASLDGRPVGSPFDGYAEALQVRGGTADLGIHELKAGTHRMKFELKGRNPAAGGAYLGVCDLVLRPRTGR